MKEMIEKIKFITNLFETGVINLKLYQDLKSEIVDYYIRKENEKNGFTDDNDYLPF